MLEGKHNLCRIPVPAKPISSAFLEIGVKLRSSHKGPMFMVVQEIKHEKSPVISIE